VNAEKAAQLVMEPYRLEGFDAVLRGRRLFVVGVDAGLRRFAALESESLYRGKNVLVLGEGSIVPLAVWRRKWDVIFRIRDSFDAQMIATYVANAAKPSRVFWLGGEIPRTLWTRWVKQDITLIGSGTVGATEWEAIFFDHGCEMAVIERVLGQRGVGSSLAQVREHLSELAASGAALVWSNIDEAGVFSGRGSLYWYDPESVAEVGTGLIRAEIAQMLDAVKKWAETGK
jgi:hypothetical protein